MIVLGKELFEQSFHDERGTGFARMDASRKDNQLFALWVTNAQQRDFSSFVSSAQNLRLCFVLKVIQQVL